MNRILRSGADNHGRKNDSILAARATPEELGEFCRGGKLRLGTWGDPGAIDPAIWRPAIEAAAERTGYTHRWRDTGAALQGSVMASVDSTAERDEAQAVGWSTFRVDSEGADDRSKGEAHCPASAEAGRKTTCAVCPIKCNGAGLSVKILDHGPGGIGRRIAARN